MIKFTKKLAIAASLMTLSAGYFDVLASKNGLVPTKIESTPTQRLTITDTVTPITAEDTKEGFFPKFPPDMQGLIVRYLRERCNILILAQVNKAWYRALLNTEFSDRDNDKGVSILSSNKTGLIPETVRGWVAQRIMKILRNGIFQYQPKGSVAIEVQLSDMYMNTTNGDLILPKDVSRLCVTILPNTFVNPVAPNTKKTIVLLLTLSELKRVAQQISTDHSFLENVAQADLSQNAVCALIRYGGHDLTTWGFRYTILKFSEMSNLAIWKIYTHDKSMLSRRATSWKGVLDDGAGVRFLF